ncbi:hypothetical protein [Aeromonas diversa]|uniref:alpha-L-rhamnosidase-related protein n=1 Tax=Aeromonas diversa TaxID=502790 RepID=UPI00346205BB
MKLHPVAMAVALCSSGLLLSACNQNDSSTPANPEAKTPPWSFDLYMVGEFSGWNRDNKFKFVYRDGAYHLDNLRLNSGMPPFKVAGPEWGTYPDFAADTQKETAIQPGHAYPMYYLDGGQNNRLVVERKGLFDIRVEVNRADLAAPGITFTMERDDPVYPETLYLLGIEGSREPVLSLTYLGDGRYVTVARLAAGDHKLEIGSAGGELGLSSLGAQAKPSESLPLARCDGACTPFSLTLAQEGFYRFELDASRTDAPRLTVTAVSSEDLTLVNPHQGHEAVEKLPFETYQTGVKEEVTFSVLKRDAALREYAQSTTQELRDPVENYVSYREEADLPRVRTGSLAFDALFALANHEMRLNSVSEVKDGSYNGGRAIPCDCFETGAKWHYVWTRDLSYATDLGLGTLDPQRARNSLQFKLSPFRSSLQGDLSPRIPEGAQIVQDTGTGGSWPISTDRVTWAMGAEAVLDSLSDAERLVFARQVYGGLKATLESDRLAAFDPADGLYTGEQSYLDWREQTYARWITGDIAHIGMSKALSTNVNHYRALRLAARLADQQGESEAASRYEGWARDLKLAINRGFWMPEQGMYASLIYGATDASQGYRFDMLGEALAIVSGIADEQQARSIVSRYPFGPFGAPVYFPQQPDVPVYHNRSIWPFVTAYALKAAVQVKSVAAVDRHVDTLMRGAALNLSNMENLEWLSGQPSLMDLDHPELSGPVINSQRQLWSVGGYLGMVTSDIFGYRVEEGGLRLKPFVTTRLHRLMGGSDSVTLEGLNYRGKTISIGLQLPAQGAAGGYYPVAGIRLNGNEVSGDRIDASQLQGSNRIEIRFGAAQADEQPVTLIEGVDPRSVDDPSVFAPREPQMVAVTRRGDGVAVEFSDRANRGGVTYNLYRNGQRVASGLTEPRWLDASLPATDGACYSAEAVYGTSGHRSHHAKPLCLNAVQERIPVTDARVRHDGSLVTGEGIEVTYLKDWGAPGEQLLIGDLPIEGKRMIRLEYFNGHHAINLGVTNGVKLVEVMNPDGAVVASGVVQMPHVMKEGEKKPLRESTPLAVDLPAGRYSVRVSDFYNMSYLGSNESYNDAGGREGPVNRVDLAALLLTDR